MSVMQLKAISEKFNKEVHPIPLDFDYANKMSGSIEFNVNAGLKRIVINPALIESFGENNNHIYILLHELGHAIDLLETFNGNLHSYSGMAKRSLMLLECGAWRKGIEYGLEHGIIEPAELKEIKKFSKRCLATYNKGKTVSKLPQYITILEPVFEGGN